VDDVPAFEPVTEVKLDGDDVSRFPDMVVRHSGRRVRTPGRDLQFAATRAGRREEATRAAGRAGSSPSCRRSSEPDAGASRPALACAGAERPYRRRGGVRAPAGKESSRLRRSRDSVRPRSTAGFHSGVHTAFGRRVRTYREARTASWTADLFFSAARPAHDQHSWAAEDGVAGSRRQRPGGARPTTRLGSVLGDRSVLAKMAEQPIRRPREEKTWSRKRSRCAREWYATTSRAQSDADADRPDVVRGVTKTLPDDGIFWSTRHPALDGGMYDLRTATPSYSAPPTRLGVLAGLGRSAPVRAPVGCSTRRPLLYTRRDRTAVRWGSPVTWQQHASGTNPSAARPRLRSTRPSRREL